MGRKVVFLTLFILIMSFSSCFASTTYEEFNNILNQKGYGNLPIESNTSSIFNMDKVFACFYDFDDNGNPKKLFIGGRSDWDDDYEPVLRSINYTTEACNFIFYLTKPDKSKSGNLIGVSFNIDSSKNFTFNTNGTSATIPIIKYEDYSEIYTLEEFISPKFMKKLFVDSIVYNDYSSLYLSTDQLYNLTYKFDGVFTGNSVQNPYTSKFEMNTGMLRFDYTAYTDLEDASVINYFFLQEFSPNQAVKITETDLNFTDDDINLNSTTKLTRNFGFLSLTRSMQEGYIYRLYCFSNQHDSNGELIRTTDATSCFFSLNSWESDSIKVVNLYDYLGQPSDDITQLPDDNTGGSSDISGTLDNINTGIGNINNFINSDISKTSGEIENALNVDVNVTDPTADFFTWFFNQIVDCFTVDSNQVLSFSILGENFKINSDDYIINIPILKNVIGIGSSIFIFYGIFVDIRREIEKIKEGKFTEIANEDISANMM